MNLHIYKFKAKDIFLFFGCFRCCYLSDIQMASSYLSIHSIRHFKIIINWTPKIVKIIPQIFARGVRVSRSFNGDRCRHFRRIEPCSWNELRSCQSGDVTCNFLICFELQSFKFSVVLNKFFFYLKSDSKVMFYLRSIWILNIWMDDKYQILISFNRIWILNCSAYSWLSMLTLQS